jgi:uncharacterized low-complexity protein
MTKRNIAALVLGSSLMAAPMVMTGCAAKGANPSCQASTKDAKASCAGMKKGAKGSCGAMKGKKAGAKCGAGKCGGSK